MNFKMNEKQWSYLPAVIGYGSVAIVGLNDIDSSQKLLWAALLLAAFGLFYFIHLPCTASEILKQTRIGIQAGLITGLLVIRPGWSVFPLLFFLMSAEVVFDFKIKTGLIWVVVFTLLTALAFTFDIGWSGLVQLLPFAAGYFFFAIFGWYRVQAVEEREEAQKLLAELQTAHEQLRQYTIQLEEFTIARERNRIAREMHDTLGHRLTIASVQLEGAQRLIHTDPERVDKIIGTVREQVKDGLGELRRTVAMLRAPEEEDLPMEQALTQLANQVHEATGIPVLVSIASDFPDLSSIYRQAFYRAAQEGLTNIQRHSKASQAWLQLSLVSGDIQLLISDNGIGYSAKNSVSGFGLTGLKERATLLNGKFSIAPRPGGGTQLSFSLPLEKEHDD
jgi:signal transduction histidine kinase